MTGVEEARLLADVHVDLSVELDRRDMTIREVLGLAAGAVIDLPRSAGENVDIYVSDTLIGYGEIVIIENSVGCRITDFRLEE